MRTESLTERVRRLARRTGLSTPLKSMVRALGYDLVRRHYYSPIPDPHQLSGDFWTRVDDLRGLKFDAAAGLDFIQRELTPFLGEYRPPLAATGEVRDFYLANTLYEGVDAETLYAMVRRFAPKRIIELGSGFSTLVMADARARNNSKQDTQHVVYDPYPRSDLVAVLRTIADVHTVSALDIPLDEFGELRSGDLLFVDTTHVVKVGGDVNRVILDVLPTLAPGVLVHFHDIFLPWEYPRDFLLDRGFFWSEQYLLQAFLAFNERFEVLFSAHALQRLWPDVVAQLIPNVRPETRPAAFWLRRTER